MQSFNSYNTIKNVCIAFGLATVLVLSTAASDAYFEINKNIDIISAVYKELNTNYVDAIDADKLFTKGIDNMLASLDPYTTFYSEDERGDFKFQISGKYGGVGSQVAIINNEVVIAEVFEGFPAQKSGLQAGDVILKINNTDCHNITKEEVSKLLRGEVNTKFNITIKRPGISENITKEITREEITLKSLSYSGIVGDNIAYIKYNQFTDKSSQDVQDAIKQLKNEHPNLKGIIFDLRYNPGGILGEAVNIANIFLKKGEDIVTTKGKLKEWERVYKTSSEPITTDIPLVVLTNKGSASASEIVAGSIQDYDRGVIMGQRTYGKGLVQTTKTLPYHTKIKITTAKYYIASGRCIQAIDYSNKNEDGSASKIPDSLRHTFHTKGGRVVKDGAGIEPDVVLDNKEFSPLISILVNKGFLIEYATQYKLKHATIPDAADFSISNADFDEFANWLKTQTYDYKTETEKALDEVKKAAESEQYYKNMQTDFEKAISSLNHDKTNDLYKYKKEIIDLINLEIVHRYYYQKGKIALSCKHDEEILKAIELLNNPSKYQELLKK